MPIQTTISDKVNIPTGTKVEVKVQGDPTYTELGKTMGDATATYNFDRSIIEFSDGGKFDPIASNPSIACNFSLANLDPVGLEILGSGLIEKVTTAGSPVATIPVQNISAGWADDVVYDLVLLTSSSDSTPLYMGSTQPTISSVQLDPDGTPEALVEDNDYVVFANPNSQSGWSISMISANIVKGSPTTFPIRITFGTNTPVASTTLHAGTGTKQMTAFQFRMTVTDSSSNITYEMLVHEAYIDSGAISYVKKAANSGGVDEMPIAFTGYVDTTLTDGRQLFSVTTT